MLVAQLLLLAGLRGTAGSFVDANDVPSFRFACWVTNSLDAPAAPPPPPHPAAPPLPFVPCSPNCSGPAMDCIGGSCCSNLRGDQSFTCTAGAQDVYTFTVGGTWFDPSTWACNATSVGRGRWGNWSSPFTPAMAQHLLNTTLCFPNQYGTPCFWQGFPGGIGAKMGIRSSRKDHGQLNITCDFQFTATAKHPADAGKVTRITARIQNSNSSEPGWDGMKYCGGDGCGGYIGLMIGRSDDAEPSVITYADFNREAYWRHTAAIPAAQLAEHFPILDSFEADGDLTTKADAFAQFTRLGVNIASGVQPADWTGRRSCGDSSWTYGADGTGVLGVPGRFRKGPTGPVACSTDGSACSLHDYSTANSSDSQLVNATDIAQAARQAFPAPVKPGSQIACAMADEPGWSAPIAIPVATSGVVRQRWVRYLQGQQLSPADFGQTSWDAVTPNTNASSADLLGELPPPLTARRRFYWSIRFQHADSCMYVANWTAAFKTAAGDPGLQTYVNWNNFAGTMYTTGGGIGDAQAQLSYDWMEWARLGGGSLLWTEDWFSDVSSQRWSYYAARMRSAIALANRTGTMEFSGYIVVQSSGQEPGRLAQRALALVGSGAKLLRYYTFGPSYMYPGNSYSDVPNATRLFAEIARANGMIARAEHVLWKARRSAAQIAILYPRSSVMWDMWHKSDGQLCQCCCTNSMVGYHIDYVVEAFGLYVALAIDSNIPVDFLDEDALLEPSTLAQYKLIIVTQPDVPTTGMVGLRSWVKAGGTLVTTSGAATGDRYNEPSTIISDLAGYTESPRQRLVFLEGELPPGAATMAGEVMLGQTIRPFEALGVAGSLSLNPDAAGSPGLEVLGNFSNGSAAVISNRGGDLKFGRLLHFAWLPGSSYWYSNNAGVRDASLRGLLQDLAITVAGVVRPVATSRVQVETPLMIGPEEDNAVVTVLNWGQAPTTTLLHLNVSLPFHPSAVESIAHGVLEFSVLRQAGNGGNGGFRVELAVPLDEVGDFIILTT